MSAGAFRELKPIELTVGGGRVHVLFASHGHEKPRGRERLHQDLFLAQRLWTACAVDTSDGAGDAWEADRTLDLRIGLMGRPELTLDGLPGPSVSFSHAAGKTWAAMAATGWSVGLDAAAPEEFAEPYPLRRVFGEAELTSARGSIGDNPSASAALLWSAKESLVKALGCGFHLVRPIDVTLRVLNEKDGMLDVEAALSESARKRFPWFPDDPVAIRSFWYGAVWVSVATEFGPATRFIQARPIAERRAPSHSH